jgi:HlyD family secretion protein
LKKFLIAALVVVALGVIVFASIRGTRREKGTKVYFETASRRALGQVVKASGEIDPRVKVNISAHVIAKIERLFVEEGDRIEKGQPFLELEKEAFTAERDRWAAQLRRAQTEVQQSQVSLADARLKLDRARKLQAEGIITREALESAQLTETSAELSLQDAREAVEQAQANLVKARDDLGKTTIYAPLSGRVVKLNAEEGEVVVSGTMNNAASVIGTIADLSEILANVDVDETEIVEVRPGQQAVVRVDALRRSEAPASTSRPNPTSPSSTSRSCSTTPARTCVRGCRCGRRSRRVRRRARSSSPSRRWCSGSPRRRRRSRRTTARRSAWSS